MVGLYFLWPQLDRLGLVGGIPGQLVVRGVLGWGKASGELYEGLRGRERITGCEETKVGGEGLSRKGDG